MMDTVQKSLGTKQVLTTAAVKNSLASRFSLLSPWGMGTEAKAMPIHGGLSQCLMGFFFIFNLFLKQILNLTPLLIYFQI